MHNEDFVEYIKTQTGKDYKEICMMLLKLTNFETRRLEELKKESTKSDVPYPIIMIVECVKELGWDLVIPKNLDGSDNLNGLIVGARPFIEAHMDSLNLNR